MEATAPQEPRSRLVLPEWLEAGLIGGLTVVVVFLVRDLARGEALLTPSSLGVALLTALGIGGAPEAPRGAAVIYNLVHFTTWIALGFVAARIVRRAEDLPGRRWLPVTALALALAALVGAELARVAAPPLWPGGLAGLLAMGGFLLWRHPGLLRR